MSGEAALHDGKCFSWLAGGMTALVLLVLTANATQETFLSGAGEYLKRRLYYEQVLSRKGLSLHKGNYWKEKE